MKMEGQMERIVLLEEEVATLHWKKACTCREGKGKGVAVASTSGDQEDQSEPEYAEEEEGSSSGVSYHVLLVVPEEPLLVFGSSISQTLPSEVQETCGCPVPAIIAIEDNVEMSMVPRENEEAIPVQVERPPVYAVDLLVVGQWLTIVLLLAMPTIMPNNLGHIHIVILRQVSSSHVSENCSSMPVYSQVDEDGIRRALDTLQDRLLLHHLFEEMPMEGLWSELQHLVLIQHAIVHVLQIVGETASGVLQILVDHEAQVEEEASQGDDVVDVGYGVDTREDFDYDGNDVE